MFLFILASSDDAVAYPWMIRHNYGGCATCHADPSGGELLTLYGRVQGDLLLRMRYGADVFSAQASEAPDNASFDSFDFDEEDEEADARPLHTSRPAEPERSVDEESPSTAFLGLLDHPPWLLLGGSYRHAITAQKTGVRTFPMQLDAYGQVALSRLRAAGSLGAARVKAASPHARAAQFTSNQGDDWNLISRTHWIGADLGAEREVLVRAGRMNLPFGLRIPEHTAWVRSATRTDRESSQQHGFAVAYTGDWLRGEGMGILGNYQISPDEFRERGYSAYLEAIVGEGVALGASSLFTIAEVDRATLEPKIARGSHGVFGRMRVAKPVVVLVEANSLSRSRSELGYVGFLQLDIEAIQGLHVGGTAEVLDEGYEKQELAVFPTSRAPGAGKPRFGGWLTVDWFFLPQLELRIDGIARQQDGLMLLAQLHAYL